MICPMRTILFVPPDGTYNKILNWLLISRVADWHASLNNKMGGDMKKIQTVGNYFVEVWKAVGMEGLNEKVILFPLAAAGHTLDV